MMDIRYEVPERSLTEVWTRLSHHETFWREIAGVLSAEDAQRLLSWMKRQAAADKTIGGSWAAPAALRAAAGA